MNAKQAAEKIVDIVEELAFDEYLQASAIEPIIQQCRNDALEAAAEAIWKHGEGNCFHDYPIEELVSLVREMKGQKQ